MNDESPPCECHGEPQLWGKSSRCRAGGFWYCRIKHREAARRWKKNNPEKNQVFIRRSHAAKLARGERVMSCHDHHKGMAELKAQLGDPRPEGLQLSLVNYDSPDSYWGYARRKRERYQYRLSTNPDDYVWETRAENEARKGSHVERREVLRALVALSPKDTG